MAIDKIMGSETELGITTRDAAGFDPVGSSIFLINALPGGPPRAMWDYAGENPLLDARGFEVSGERERPSQQDNRAINKVLLNGGRLYVDGAHPEYSTPETTNARDLELFDKAGERIVDRCRAAANQKLPPPQQLLVYKNNSDGKGNSYGYHENYLVARSVPFERLVEGLTPFLVSRIVICGAGKVGAENGTDPCDYQISQRAYFFETLIGLDTMAKRPIINTRDEPHADEEKYRRLHVIVGDANMSEITTYLKVGITAIVLAMVEDDFLRKDLALEDPVRAIKEISHDPTCRRTVRLKRGVEVSAVELQREYLACALDYYATAEQSPQVSDLLERWQSVLDRLAEDPQACGRELDWVIKRELITSYMTRKDIGFGDQRLSLLDLQYHDLRQDKGLYFTLEREGYVDRLLNDAEILQAMTQPPTDTRAYFRGMCLHKFPEQTYGASWSSILLDTGESTVKKIPMAEPGRGTRKLVGDILERSESVADLLERLAG
ncbi:MAG TPA: depupylase/deamidase Dop [Candidatus Acidoferrum sp.]|nr:depupylase/deamidase Dop [Candidatus Acidoferrum sp.]